MILASIWEPIGVAAMLLVGGLTGLFAGVRWLAERARQDSDRREQRFDDIDDTLNEHGERLSTVEGKLSITPTSLAARRRATR